MNNKDFTYSFESGQSIEAIFETLIDPGKWWVGFFDESISGKSEIVDDEFTFIAGGGMHNTTQRLIELIPNKKITWLVTKSNLSFLTKTDEWTNTRFCFELSPNGNNTKITFRHEGLQPEIECYNSCSAGWMHYLKQLDRSLP